MKNLGGGSEPYAVRTVLGWAVLGPVDAANIMCSHLKNVNFVCMVMSW